LSLSSALKVCNSGIVIRSSRRFCLLNAGGRLTLSCRRPQHSCTHQQVDHQVLPPRPSHSPRRRAHSATHLALWLPLALPFHLSSSHFCFLFSLSNTTVVCYTFSMSPLPSGPRPLISVSFPPPRWFCRSPSQLSVLNHNR
jgi:hypothetical protein